MSSNENRKFSYSSGECTLQIGSDLYGVGVNIASASSSKAQINAVIRKNDEPFTFQTYSFTDSPVAVNVSKDEVALTGEITCYYHSGSTVYYLFNGEFKDDSEQVLQLSNYIVGFTEG